MPSSWTPSLRLEQQFTGENINLWGEKLNATLAYVDYAVAGWLTKAITGSDTLVTANGPADEARASMLRFTGTLAAVATITIPPVSKSYFIHNATNRALTFSTGAGSTVTIDPGDKTVVFCDGSSVHTITFGNLGLKDFIVAVTAGSGAVPSPIGSAGKFLFSPDGVNVIWHQPSTSDLSDYQTAIIGAQVALAVAL